MNYQDLCRTATETTYNEGRTAASQFIADTLKFVEQTQGKDAAFKLSMEAAKQTILLMREGAKDLMTKTFTDCKRITDAASKAAANNQGKHWTGESLLHGFRDTCSVVLAYEAIYRVRGCAPRQWETIAVQALPERLLHCTSKFMAEAGPAIVNSASDRAQAAADMQGVAALFNDTVVTPLCVAYERLQGHADLIDETGKWCDASGWIPGILRSILSVAGFVALFNNVHAPTSNPFSELFVMELEAELALLEKTLTA
jgi:hypothetical protein